VASRSTILPRPMKKSLPWNAGATRGFTLIELLTVIAIIGILAAILIPTVGRVRDSARGSQCASNMRQVALAIRLFAEDNKGMLPAARADNTSTPPVNPAVEWTTAINSYLPKPAGTGRNAVLTCPSNNYLDAGGNPANPVAHTYALAPGSTALNAFGNDSSGNNGRTLSSIINPSFAVWLLEGKISSTTFNNATTTIGRTPIHNSFTTVGDNPVQFWHGNNSRTNIAFGDGSVRLMSPAEFNERYPDIPSVAGFRKLAGR
jgi:prepilin-type N-terminal cleavage/methylation domain-containing protein/prepilin-type processing-associated H-X9-DG protein